MMDRDLARSVRDLAGRSARGLGPVVLCLLAGSVAQAREVTFPKDHPKISMSVPDDWSVDYTDFGLEIRSPEKKLYIVADLLPRQKAQADGWAKKAVGKIEQFGVKFGAPAAQREAKQAPATKPVEPTTSSPASAPASPAASKPGAKVPVDRSAPSFTFLNPPTAINPPAPVPEAPAPVFFGAPSLDTPKKPEGQLAVKTDIPAGMTIEQLSMTSSTQRPKIPFKVGSFPNGTLDGQAVDVQIVNFGLSPKELFLVLQASLSTDDRAVAVIQSVKPAT